MSCIFIPFTVRTNRRDCQHISPASRSVGNLKSSMSRKWCTFHSVDGPNAHFTVRTDRKLLLWTILDNPPGEGNKSAPGNDVDNREYSIFCFPFLSFVLESDWVKWMGNYLTGNSAAIRTTRQQDVRWNPRDTRIIHDFCGYCPEECVHAFILPQVTQA